MPSLLPKHTTMLRRSAGQAAVVFEVIPAPKSRLSSLKVPGISAAAPRARRLRVQREFEKRGSLIARGLSNFPKSLR